MADNLTPVQRSLRARVAAYTKASMYDGRDATQPARSAFLASFETQVDPEGILPPAERARRAEAARRAHMTRLSYQAAKARSAARPKTAPKTSGRRAEGAE